TVNATVSGTGEAPPSGLIDVSSASLDFGTIFDDETADLNLTIANLTDVNLEVSGLSFGSGTDFELVGAPALPFDLVNSTSTQVITVRFNPATAGVKGDTLTITSDDFFNPSTAVTLAGEAFDAPVLPFIDTFDVDSSTSYTVVNTDGTATFGGTYTAIPL